MSSDKGGSGVHETFVTIERHPWIACADRQPATSDPVIAWARGLNFWASCRWDEMTGGRHWVDAEREPIDVTHWMPLPEEPK